MSRNEVTPRFVSVRRDPGKQTRALPSLTKVTPMELVDVLSMAALG